MSPRVGRSRSKVTRRRSVTRAAAASGEKPTAEHRQVQREQRDGHRRADDLEAENRPRDAVVEPRETHALLVDGVVERLDVEARGGRGRSAGDRLPREPPESTLELRLLCRRPLHRIAVRDLARHLECEVGVAPQQVQRRETLWLGEHWARR